MTSAVYLLRHAERETCSKPFIRSAWALSDALYKSNEVIASMSIKAEAWQRIQEEEVEEMNLRMEGRCNGLGLEYWDNFYARGGMDKWVVFPHS